MAGRPRGRPATELSYLRRELPFSSVLASFEEDDFPVPPTADEVMANRSTASAVASDIWSSAVSFRFAGYVSHAAW